MSGPPLTPDQARRLRALINLPPLAFDHGPDLLAEVADYARDSVTDLERMDGGFPLNRRRSLDDVLADR